MRVTAVIRSAGERTERACLDLIEADDIHVIREVPFERAVRRSFELGAGADWLMTVDADMLPLPGAQAAMRRMAAEAPTDVFQFQGQGTDRLTMNTRDCGVRFWRGAHLPEAMEHVPEPGASHRPESAARQVMHDRGRRSVQVQLVTCLHDYERYFRDVYQKAALHSAKHPRWLHLPVAWRRSESIEYRVAARGWADGGPGVTDVRVYQAAAEAALEQLGIEERKPLPEGWTPDFGAMTRC